MLVLSSLPCFGPFWDPCLLLPLSWQLQLYPDNPSTMLSLSLAGRVQAMQWI